MSPSVTPGDWRLHTPNSSPPTLAFTKFQEVRLFRDPTIRFTWGWFSELNYGSLALQPVDLFALLTDRTELSLSCRGLLLPGFRRISHLIPAPDMTTVAIGQLPPARLSLAGIAASFAALELIHLSVLTHCLAFSSPPPSPAAFPDPLPSPVARSHDFRHAGGNIQPSDY